jgi:hypothetical protein
MYLLSHPQSIYDTMFVIWEYIFVVDSYKFNNSISGGALNHNIVK